MYILKIIPISEIENKLFKIAYLHKQRAPCGYKGASFQPTTLNKTVFKHMLTKFQYS